MSWLSYSNSTGLAQTSMEIYQWARGTSKGEKCHDCYSLSQLTKSPSEWILLSFCLEFVHLLKMNKICKAPEFIYIYHSNLSLFCNLIFCPLFIQNLYILMPSPPAMWISQDHMLLCLWLLVTTFAYVFAHYNVISLRSRPCNRSYQEWHHAILFSQDLPQLVAIIFVVVRIHYLPLLAYLTNAFIYFVHQKCSLKCIVSYYSCNIIESIANHKKTHIWSYHYKLTIQICVSTI